MLVERKSERAAPEQANVQAIALQERLLVRSQLDVVNVGRV